MSETPRRQQIDVLYELSSDVKKALELRDTFKALRDENDQLRKKVANFEAQVSAQANNVSLYQSRHAFTNLNIKVIRAVEYLNRLATDRDFDPMDAIDDLRDILDPNCQFTTAGPNKQDVGPPEESFDRIPHDPEYLRGLSDFVTDEQFREAFCWAADEIERLRDE